MNLQIKSQDISRGDKRNFEGKTDKIFGTIAWHRKGQFRHSRVRIISEFGPPSAKNFKKVLQSLETGFLIALPIQVCDSVSIVRNTCS
uniref:Uncharacterized protein n=1 Tax=Pararge aegeria TaxID=116150 RepID=S4PFE0_9NEOP